MKITRLQCDYMENPVGFDFKRPLLQWVVEAEGSDKRQSAYRLQIAKDVDFSQPCFDTGKLLGAESAGYQLEMPLEACTRYNWRVNVWDEADNESGFSQSAYFETARYGQPWVADWIGGDAALPQLSMCFNVVKPVRRARAYACGVGLYRLYLNGSPASDELLTPGFVAYDQWLPYQTYDVTELLSIGSNIAGVWLGNSYYKGRVNWPGIEHRENIYGDQLGFIMELSIEYQDGSTDMVLTDTSWEAAASPYRRAEIYDGEVFDARLWAAEWQSHPEAARAKRIPIDKGLLQARRSVPMRVMQVLPVKAKLQTPLGEQVMDFGQNLAGRIRIRLGLPKGTEVLFQFGEVLDEKGNFYRDNMRTALAELRYIGDGTEREYTPNFTYFGFRYVRVSGWEIAPEQVTAEAIYSGLRRTGDFDCSDERVNRLYQNALWSQRSNFLDNPTDCPQRDERMGWTADAQVFCPTACMNMQSDAFFRKYLYDLRLEQKKLGFVPVVVPYILAQSGIWQQTVAGWGDAAVLIPWTLYLYYGDHIVLETQYDSMKTWVDYIRAQDKEASDLYQGFQLGDWLAQDTKDPDNLFGLTPTSLVATAYYAWSAEHVSKAARVLGKVEDAERYASLAERVREAFRREFVSPNGRVSSETQTAYLLALNMNMLTEMQRIAATQHLKERLDIDHCQLTTGFLGTPCLCPVLSEVGLDEYAYELLLQTKCPSWLYEVEHGATTVWERWNSVRPDGTMGDVSMNSFNHYAFGSIVEWLYRYMAGINPVEEAPGYRRARIQPHVSRRLSYARASIETPYGQLDSGWRLETDRLTLDITIPFNTSAEVFLPGAEDAQIIENGQEITAEDYRDGCAVLRRGSGRWHYEYRIQSTSFERPVGGPPHL